MLSGHCAFVRVYTVDDNFIGHSSSNDFEWLHKIRNTAIYVRQYKISHITGMCLGGITKKSNMFLQHQNKSIAVAWENKQVFKVCRKADMLGTLQIFAEGKKLFQRADAITEKDHLLDPTK